MTLEFTNINNQFNNIKEVAKNYFHMSDKLLLKLKNQKKILLNKSVARISDKIAENDLIEFDLNYDEDSENIVATEMNLDIIFEDESFLIINKAPHTPVHPSINHYEDSLSNGVKYYFDKIKLHKKIRPVNRLDKDTSGLVVFAKNEYIQENLIRQMKRNEFEKEYIAVLDGILQTKEGVISAPISRKDGSIIEREVNFETGQEAITYYQVLKKENNLSLVKFKLETGRTHQIRVHSKYLGAAILGDSLYHKSSDLIDRQALHAIRIEFVHPILKKKISFETKIPKDIQNIFNNHNWS